MAHVILNLKLCGPIERKPDTTAFAAHVQMVDRTGATRFARTFRIERGDENTQVVEFDAPWGIYRLGVDAAQYGCSASTFVSLFPNTSRSVKAHLSAHPTVGTVPMLLDGKAPSSFFYVKPTFEIFDAATTACGKPIGTPLASDIRIDDESDAYYASLYPEPPIPPGITPLLALRLQTPTHQYHYVRLPVPLTWGAWPSSLRLNVSQNMVEALATDPVGTLLCPRLWETSVS